MLKCVAKDHSLVQRDVKNYSLASKSDSKEPLVANDQHVEQSLKSKTAKTKLKIVKKRKRGTIRLGSTRRSRIRRRLTKQTNANDVQTTSDDEGIRRMEVIAFISRYEMCDINMIDYRESLGMDRNDTLPKLDPVAERRILSNVMKRSIDTAVDESLAKIAPIHKWQIQCSESDIIAYKRLDNLYTEEQNKTLEPIAQTPAQWIDLPQKYWSSLDHMKANTAVTASEATDATTDAKTNVKTTDAKTTNVQVKTLDTFCFDTLTYDIIRPDFIVVTSLFGFDPLHVDLRCVPLE